MMQFIEFIEGGVKRMTISSDDEEEEEEPRQEKQTRTLENFPHAMLPIYAVNQQFLNRLAQEPIEVLREYYENDDVWRRYFGPRNRLFMHYFNKYHPGESF